MARLSHHRSPRTVTPRWAARSISRARRFEQQVARHWPFAAYTALTLATGGYVIAQLARIA